MFFPNDVSAPNIFQSVSESTFAVAEYCSTVFRYRKDLEPGTCEPPGCLWTEDAKVAAQGLG